MTDQTTNRQIYRGRVKAGDLVGFSVAVAQTDLFIRAGSDLTEKARDLILEGRRRIEAWAASHPAFLTSMTPLPGELGVAPPVKDMLAASKKAGVGPMAAVAGAMAAFVGKGLKPFSPEGIVVENGGDVFLDGAKDMTIGLFAGNSPLSLRLGLDISSDLMPVGVCTSSGTLGHSLSYGRADAATVVAADAALADAAATALGNRIRKAEDIEPSLEWVMTVSGVVGAVAIVGERIGFMGDLTVVRL